jgi:hypothetical protein
VEVPSVRDKEGRALFDSEELVHTIGRLLYEHMVGQLPQGFSSLGVQAEARQ